jgi:hypothetical protein
MESEQRKSVIHRINEDSVHTKCAKVCAYHEMNKYLHSLMEGSDIYQPADRSMLSKEEVS